MPGIPANLLWSASLLTDKQHPCHVSSFGLRLPWTRFEALLLLSHILYSLKTCTALLPSSGQSLSRVAGIHFIKDMIAGVRSAVSPLGIDVTCVCSKEAFGRC